MTAPVTQLPHVSLGNLAQDISSGAANFVSGMKAEQARRREEAMARALLELRQYGAETERLAANAPLIKAQIATQQATEAAKTYIARYPDLAPFATNPEEVINRGRQRDDEQLYGARPGQPQLTDIELTPGRPQKAWMYPPPRGAPAVGQTGGVAPTAPPTSIVPTGQRPYVPQPPYTPPTAGSPVSTPTVNVPSAPGGAIRPTGIGTKVTPSYGYLNTPRPQELDAANWVPGVLQGFTGVRDMLVTNPAAAQEALPFLAGLQVVSDIPGFGNALAAAMNSAKAAGLSQQAQQFVQHYVRFRASRVFAAGGKQLTGNEIRESTSQFLPSPNEDPSVIQQRLEGMAADALGAIQSTGRAWTNRRAEFLQLGSPDLGEFNPLTQTFSNQVTLTDMLNARPGTIPTIVPGAGRPGPVMNPRFDPRR